MNRALETRLAKIEATRPDESAPNFHWERAARLGKIVRCIGQDEADRLLAEDPERFVICHIIVDPAEQRDVA